MDPIHPIVPVAPGVTPVHPPPRVAPARDQAGRGRQDPGERRRKREQAPRDPRAASYWDPSDADDAGVAWEPTDADDDAGEDDGRPHIDISA